MTSVYDFWFSNKKYWIPISQKDKDHIDKFIAETFPFFEEEIVTTKKYIIGMIIYHDQFYRHIHRYHKVVDEEFIRKSREKMLPFVDMLNTNELEEEELIFVLMPLKHLYDYKTVLEKVLEWTKYRNKVVKDFVSLSKFFQDTYQKMYTLPYIQKNVKLSTFTGFDFDPMEVCEKYVEKYEVNSNVFTIQNLDHAIVSLSGGVDSMTILTLLKNMHTKVTACHLIYGNREESWKEFAIVQEFCHKLQVPLYYYVIEHLKRKEVEREFYERMTRDIRFNLYKSLIKEGESYGVFLGHIQDDVIENVWTNFAKGQHLFNLQKMEQDSIQEGVRLIRPFLYRTKKEILGMATVPYLKNTTPAWSNRGKFRTNFYKATHEQFGEMVDERVLEVAKTLEGVGKILENTIYKPVLSSFDGFKLNVTRAIEAELGVGEWSYLFEKFCHNHLHTNKPSVHSIQQFIDRIRKKEWTTLRFHLKKDLEFILCKDETEFYIKMMY